MLEKRAYAKINLGLDVLGKRQDGYHELRMVMQTVDLYDILTFEKKESGITVTTDHAELPGDESNLVYQAAKLVTDRFSIREGVGISLKKRIPMAAGLAGGSADAAAVFHAMNELFSLGLSEEALREMGVRIGADVPYCIMGGAALAEGIGERLTPLPKLPACYLVLSKPQEGISTGQVYRTLDASGLAWHPDIDGMVKALKEKDLKGIAARLGNVLETVTIKQCPVIEEIKSLLKKEGALGALMSGSGPTVFGIFTQEARAQAALWAVSRAFPEAHSCCVQPAAGARHCV